MSVNVSGKWQLKPQLLYDPDTIPVSGLTFGDDVSVSGAGLPPSTELSGFNLTSKLGVKSNALKKSEVSLPFSTSDSYSYVVVPVGTSIYIFYSTWPKDSGQTSSNTSTGIKIFDTVTKTIEDVTFWGDTVDFVNVTCGCLVSNKIYIFKTGAANHAVIFDIKANRCTKRIFNNGEGGTYTFNISSCAPIGRIIYLYNEPSSSTDHEQRLITFSTSNDTVSIMSDLELPTPKYNVTCVTFNFKVYLFGGYDIPAGRATPTYTYSNKIHVYDPNAKTITESNTTLPIEATSIGVTVDKYGGLYLFGGYDANEHKMYDTIYYISQESIDSGSFILLPSKISETNCRNKCVSVGSDIYIFDSTSTAIQVLHIGDIEIAFQKTNSDGTSTYTPLYNTATNKYSDGIIPPVIFDFGDTEKSISDTAYDWLADNAVLRSSMTSKCVPGKWRMDSAIDIDELPVDYICNGDFTVLDTGYQGFRVAVTDDKTEVLNEYGTFFPYYRTAFAAVGTKIYAFGGYDGSANVDHIRVLDTTTGVVDYVKPGLKLPFPIAKAVCATVGTKIYLFGGNDQYPVIIFDTKTNSIETVSTDLSKSEYLMCAAVGTKIYLFGGDATTNVSVFDTETYTGYKTTSSTNSLIDASVRCAAVGTNIYILGLNLGGSNWGNGIAVYDTARGVYRSPSDYMNPFYGKFMPRSVNKMGLAAFGTKIYLFGGDGGSTDGGSTDGKLDTIYVLDTVTKNFELLSAKLPAGVTFLKPPVVVGFKVYFVETQSSSGWYTKMYSFSPSAKTLCLASTTGNNTWTYTPFYNASIGQYNNPITPPVIFDFGEDEQSLDIALCDWMTNGNMVSRGIEIPVTSAIGATLATQQKFCRKNVTVIPTLQEKSVSVSEDTDIYPDDGYAGLGKVSVAPAMKLNIEYGQAAPTDTTKLWVKAGKPESFKVTGSPDRCNPVNASLPGSLPMCMDSSVAVTVGSKIYLFGGTNGTVMLNTINVFDTETNAVDALSTTLPIGAYGIAGALVGSKIYLFGGRAGTGDLNAINVFDTETNTIETMSTALPSSAQVIACSAVGSKIYLFGGISGNDVLNTINVFDTETNTIETLSTTLSTGLYYASVAAVGSKIYLFGGHNGTTRIDAISVFNTETNTIETLSTTLPVIAVGISSVAVGSTIYLLGGAGYQNVALQTINVFDTTTNVIETLDATLPIPLIKRAFASVGTNIYLFGGREYPANARMNTITVFNTESKTVNVLSTILTGCTGYNSAAEAIGSKIYLFGGQKASGGRLDTIQVFDTTTNTTETLSVTLPATAYGIRSAAIGSKIYLVSGWTFNPLNTINVFDTTTNTIETLDVTIPATNLLPSIAAVGSKIYLFGGRDANSVGSAAINVFDTETNTIETLSVSLPNSIVMPLGETYTPTNDISCAAIGSKIYLFGGCYKTSDLGSRICTNAILVFDTETNTVDTLSVSLPNKSDDITSVAIGTKIYLFNGRNYNNDVLQTIQVFDTETNTIEMSNVVSHAVYAPFNILLVGDKLYVLSNESQKVGTVTVYYLSEIALANNAIFIHEADSGTAFNLIKDPTNVEINVKNVYRGNSNGIAEPVDAYLHNGTNWVNVNTGETT